ncbi:MAG: hypothetical protein IPP22_14810 [Nitrosomonas sp.]|nr:hypothetical protein [Nitrosomonas sp.]
MTVTGFTGSTLQKRSLAQQENLVLLLAQQRATLPQGWAMTRLYLWQVLA